MKKWELGVVGGVHLAVLGLAALIMSLIGRGDPGLALVLAAITGSQTAGFLYHRREPDPAPLSVKATTGIAMSVLAVGASVMAQVLWDWIRLPEVVIPIGALGTFIFPFVLFSSMRKATSKPRSGTRQGDG